MIYLFLAMLIWASSFVIGKIATDSLDPILVVQYRLIIATIIVAPYCVNAYRQIPTGLYQRVWLVSFALLPLCFLLQFAGLKLTSATAAITQLGLSPLITVLIGYFCFAKKATTKDFVFNIIAFIGIFIMVYGADEVNTEINLLGAVLILAGSLAFIFGMYLSEGIMQQMSAKAFTYISIPIGAITCLPFSLMLVDNWQLPTDSMIWGSVVYLGVMCSYFAMLCWNKGISMSSPLLAGIFFALEPVFDILLATLFLNESQSLLSWLGIIIVIGSTLVYVLQPIAKSKVR